MFFPQPQPHQATDTDEEDDQGNTASADSASENELLPLAQAAPTRVQVFIHNGEPNSVRYCGSGLELSHIAAMFDASRSRGVYYT